MSISKYIAAGRPINIALVIAAQWLIYEWIIKKAFNLAEVDVRLDRLHFMLFTLVTVCLTVGGYYINDAFDRPSDKANNKVRSLDKSQAIKGYIVVSSIGAVIAFYIAFIIDELHLFVIYPSAVILLYYYSKWWKGAGLIGNVIVAFFTAGVSLILILAEPQLTRISHIEIEKALHIIVAYSAFAFVLNLLREIVKDLQDLEGDRIQGYSTLPIKIGIPKTKMLIIFTTVFFLFSLGIWLYYQPLFEDLRLYSLFIIFVGAPLILSIFRINKAEHPVHFRSIATLYKWIMLVGLISIFIIK